MLLLYPKDGDFCVLLNKRSMEVEHHKGEMSFPGGARDPEDSDYEDTARRETEEEMGIARDDITILGRLDDNVTRTNFLVKVFVGTIPYPYEFSPSSSRSPKWSKFLWMCCATRRLFVGIPESKPASAWPCVLMATNNIWYMEPLLKFLTSSSKRSRTV